MPCRDPREIHQLFAQAFNAADVEALVALYEPEACLVPGSGERAVGKAAIRSAYEGSLAAKPSIRVETAYIVPGSGLALLSAKWTLAGAPERSGQSVEVVRRQPDGTWLFAIDDPFGAGRP